jgi:hypothetical protein
MAKIARCAGLRPASPLPSPAWGGPRPRGVYGGFKFPKHPKNRGVLLPTNFLGLLIKNRPINILPHPLPVDRSTRSILIL